MLHTNVNKVQIRRDNGKNIENMPVMGAAILTIRQLSAPDWAVTTSHFYVTDQFDSHKGHFEHNVLARTHKGKSSKRTRRVSGVLYNNTEISRDDVNTAQFNV